MNAYRWGECKLNAFLTVARNRGE